MQKFQFQSAVALLATLSFGVTFTGAPRLVEEGGRAVITFTVSASTDVEVGILDASGKVVRHLAAGIIGGPTSPAPLQVGLSQRLEWDGLDDYGRTLFSGPFTARVRLGVTPQFEKKISMRSFNANLGLIGSRNNAGVDTLNSDGDLIDSSHWVFHSGSNNGFYVAVTGLDLTVNDETDELLFHGYNQYSAPPMLRVNGITGQLINSWTGTGKFPLPTSPTRDTICKSIMAYFGEPVVDWFGRYLLRDESSYCGFIYRFSFDGQPLPYSTGTNVVMQPSMGGGDFRGRGFCVGPDGSLYRAHYSRLGGGLAVSQYDTNGLLARNEFIQVKCNIGQGVRVDLKGNIYLGVRIKPLGDSVPSAINGKVTGGWSQKWSQKYWAQELYGSIVKFGPEGGKITLAAGGNLMGANPTLTGAEGTALATNMKWMYYGASFQATHTYQRANGCWCYTPRFDVDRFSRVLFPNPFENEFVCLDTDGKLMYRFKNRDFAASGVKIGMIHHVQATDRALYLADHPNNQILCMIWKAEAETLLAIPTMGVDRLDGADQVLAFTVAPNPGRDGIRIGLRLDRSAGTPDRISSLKIFNPNGVQVADLTADLAQGKSSVVWSGRDQSQRPMPDGAYFCRLIAGGRSVTRTITLIK